MLLPGECCGLLVSGVKDMQALCNTAKLRYMSLTLCFIFLIKSQPTNHSQQSNNGNVQYSVVSPTSIKTFSVSKIFFHSWMNHQMISYLFLWIYWRYLWWTYIYVSIRCQWPAGRKRMKHKRKSELTLVESIGLSLRCTTGPGCVFLDLEREKWKINSQTVTFCRTQIMKLFKMLKTMIRINFKKITNIKGIEY